MTSTLFMIPYGTNEGYAIEMLERAFFDVGLRLAEGVSRKVHFSFAHLDRGSPQSLPPDFTNITHFGFADPEVADYERLTQYVRQHEIELVVALDIQPTHPVCRHLREADARTIIAYWGSPISSLMTKWKLTLKRLEILLSRHKVDSLIFESTALARFALEGRGIPKRMIDIVPTGVNTTRFFPSKSAYVYDQFGFPPNRHVCVSSGHVYEGKGIGVLVEAAIHLLIEKQRDDVCFLFCGNKNRESEPFEKRYAGLGIDKFIRFGGYRTDMDQIYPGCFCGVIPSLVEDSFPSSALEIAASGLPVVASRIGGLPDSVVDGETGVLFEPGNATELAGIIETWLDNPPLAEALGKKGRHRCETTLSTEVHRDRLEAVFRKRLQNDKSGRR